MERSIRRALAVFAVAFTFSGVAAHAGEDTDLFRLWRLCASDLVHVPPERFRVMIPIGCEVIDCCPGCPGADRINWRVRVEGAPLESVSLKFNRLPKKYAAGLKLGGTAQGSAENVLIRKGDGTIDGLPVEIAGRAPVAQIDVAFDQAWLQTRNPDNGDAENGGNSADEVAGNVTIEQYYGQHRVNEYRMGFRIPPCPAGPPDRIVLHPILDPPDTPFRYQPWENEAVVWVDARRSTGCVHESHRGTEVIGMGSVLSNGPCRSEIAVFSRQYSMQLVERLTTWSDPSGDTVHVSLTPEQLRVPVSVWAAHHLRREFTAVDFLEWDFYQVARIHDRQYTGLWFRPTVHEVADDPAALAAIGIGCDLERLRSSPYYTPGQINVYYVNWGFVGATGCRGDSNVVYIGTISDVMTLVHELGHTMGLGHTFGVLSGDPDIPRDNIMIPDNRIAESITDGQSFRMNVHCSSALNEHGVRRGAVRRCDRTIPGNVTCPAWLDSYCPPLADDARTP